MQLEPQLDDFDFEKMNPMVRWRTIWNNQVENNQAARKVNSNYLYFWPGDDRAMMHSKLNSMTNIN